jgi:hypothetical protein
MRLIEIRCQEETYLVLKHRVHAHDEIPTIFILPCQMPLSHFVGNRQETAVRTFGEFDPWLFTQARNPLVGTSQLDSQICRFCGSRNVGDRHPRVRERANEKGRFWPRVKNDYGRERLLGPWELPAEILQLTPIFFHENLSWTKRRIARAESNASWTSASSGQKASS